MSILGLFVSGHAKGVGELLLREILLQEVNAICSLSLTCKRLRDVVCNSNVVRRCLRGFQIYAKGKTSRAEREMLEKYLIPQDHVEIINLSRNGTRFVGIYQEEQVFVCAVPYERSAVLRKLQYLSSASKSPAFLNFYGIVVVCENGSFINSYYIFEDCEVGSLREFLSSISTEHSVTMREGVDLALKLTRCFKRMRDSGLCRGDIDSRQIYLNEDEAYLRACDSRLGQPQEEWHASDENEFATIAPEITFGPSADHSSDIYSLGVLLWEVFASVLRKKREEPYAEYPDIRFGFQVLIRSTKDDLRQPSLTS